MPDLTLALVVLVALAAVELAKAARWAALLGPQRPAYSRCLQALVSGQLTNLLSPLRAGEAVQLGVLSLRGGAFAPAAAALVGVKLLDAGVLLLIAAAVLGTAVLGASAAWLVVALAGACASAGIAAAGRGGRVEAVLMRLPLAERLGMRRMRDVAAALRSRQVLLIVGGTSAAVWLAGLLANAIILEAVGIPPSFDLASRVLVAGYVVGVLPAPPGRLGVFETGVTLALTSAGVSPVSALAAGVMLHMCQFLELGVLVVATVVVRKWSKSEVA